MERAVKTAAQGLLLVAGSDAANWTPGDWRPYLYAAAGGFALSILTSVATAGAGVGPSDSPSAVPVD
jgi:hypothetical protein